MNHEKPTFISLFSGCGGFDIGFTEAGYTCLGAFDIDGLALKNLNNYSNSPIYQADLSDSSLNDSGYVGNKPDVIISGSPCQGFSTIGKRKYNDPRNKLLISAAEIAVGLNPKVFVTENVPGVISGRHKEYWENAENILQSAGYKTCEMVLDSNLYGAPQRRKRMFLIAYKSPHPVHIEIQTSEGGTLRDALHNINGAANHIEEYLEPGSRDDLIASRIKQGQKLSNVRGGERSIHTWSIPEVFGKVTGKEKLLLDDIVYLRRRLRVRNFGDADPVPESALLMNHSKNTIYSLIKKNYLKQIGENYDLVGGFNGKYRRLSLDIPSCTVDTRFGVPKNFLHPLLNRGFTVREAARIQGFPDSYEFTGSMHKQFKMIGNAVPPPLSKAIATSIKSQLIGN